MRQQILKRNTYTPTDAPQVRSNCDLALNMPEKASVPGLKTSNISPDVALREPAPVERKAYAFVLNATGKPLMPTSPAKARHLVKKGLAKVVKAYPFFVIKMQVQVRNAVQDVTLGIDAGYKHIGFSAVSSKAELLCGELEQDMLTSKRIADRKSFRRLRRGRNHWYREQRVLNRSKKDGMPSLKRKLYTHVNLIQKISLVLPVSKILIEASKFSIPHTTHNVNSTFKNDIKEKNGWACAVCGSTLKKLEVHHITPKSMGGTNSFSNLIPLCTDCHSALHTNKDILSRYMFTKKSEYFMNFLYRTIFKVVKDADKALGYNTNLTRDVLNLPKTHYTDAFCLVFNGQYNRVDPVFLKQGRRNRRDLQQNRAGYRVAVRKTRYPIQAHDIFWTDKGRFLSRGTTSKGTRVLIDRTHYIHTKYVKKYFSVGSIYKVAA